MRPAVPADGPAIAAVKWRASAVAYRGVLPDAFLDQAELVPPVGFWVGRALRPPSRRHALVAWGRPGSVLGYADVGPCRDPGVDPERVGEVYELYVDPAALDSPVLWEAGVPTDPESMLFPHLYGPLPAGAVIEVTPYRPGPDGTFPPVAESRYGPQHRGVSRAQPNLVCGRGIERSSTAHYQEGPRNVHTGGRDPAGEAWIRNV